MTREEFFEDNCKMCCSIACLRDDEAISGCGYYKGDIEGIEKKPGLKELFEQIDYSIATFTKSPM